ncbi:MAG: hypothetical protein PHH85_14660 [Candidatus Methanoperedens sp.]|nr:hypothetical protein [Candidatus Methanoperedens sp.]
MKSLTRRVSHNLRYSFTTGRSPLGTRRPFAVCWRTWMYLRYNKCPTY